MNREMMRNLIIITIYNYIFEYHDLTNVSKIIMRKYNVERFDQRV